MLDNSNTITNQSVETSLALLGAKIDYNQSQTSQKLDNMQSLMALTMTHQSGLILGLSSKIEDHETRITTLETEEAVDRGAEGQRKSFIAICSAFIVGCFVNFVTFWFGHHPLPK